MKIIQKGIKKHKMAAIAIVTVFLLSVSAIIVSFHQFDKTNDKVDQVIKASGSVPVAVNDITGKDDEQKATSSKESVQSVQLPSQQSKKAGKYRSVKNPPHDDSK